MSGSSPAKRTDLDDLLVAGALTVVALLCAVFRFLPMVDLPQHYAMVSILRHCHDPAYDFAHRYTFDFLGRPYATVYWLGAALAWVMPLGAAMHAVVIVCTVAPFAGAHAWLRASGRSRSWLLVVIPFAFGSLWHWGFLNFLLGTGMFLGGLAVVVRASQAPSRRRAVALLAVSILAALHALPWSGDAADVRAGRGLGLTSVIGPPVEPYVRVLAPLAPSALAAAAFVLFTWSQAEGAWVQLNPGLGERLDRFPELLGAGAARALAPRRARGVRAPRRARHGARVIPFRPCGGSATAFAFVFAAQVGDVPVSPAQHEHRDVRVGAPRAARRAHGAAAIARGDRPRRNRGAGSSRARCASWAWR